jgi:enoyl-CoA hydratase/carnithine racemase
MDNQPVYLETHGEVAVMVLNRPDKLNALNIAIWEGVKRFSDEVVANPEIKVLIIRGATPQAFSSGADISEFPKVHATPEAAAQFDKIVRAGFDAVSNLGKPTIAMVSGYCFGGGCALALGCDLRYADRTARFCIPPARLGVAYTLRETKRLVDLVGPSKAKEMLMGAKVIEADEALTCGIVTRLFEPEDLERETFAFAEELCNLSQFTIRAVKTTVREIIAGAKDDTDVSSELRAKAFENPDYFEGRDAFLQKRKPKFTYR